jgi:hypothetical protein
MSRIYSLSADAQTVVAAPQLTFLNPPAGSVAGAGFQILRAWASQRANATSAQQGIRQGSKVTAFPTLVSATPVGSLTDPASKMVGATTGAAGTAGINSSANGGGAEVGNFPDNFNVLNGYLFVATPPELDQQIFMPGGTSGHFLQFTSTPGTLTGWSWGVVFKELG